MSLPIHELWRDATEEQIKAAVAWTSDNLHVPYVTVSGLLAVAYVVRHYEQGQLSGWDGFITDLEN